MLVSILSTLTVLGKDAEKRESVHTDGGNVTWYGHYGKSMEELNIGSKIKDRPTMT